ncbi:MAG: efflux RND transporter periplasmic adaptor subunit [Opitutales bacterium]|nr:efflux RND transporter periplasmic adaptor subunit [Opitutales bacterium]
MSTAAFRKYLPWLALAAAGPFLLLAAGCGGGGESAEAESPRGGGRGQAAPPYVEAVQTRSGALPLEQRLSGVVRARNEVAIRPEVAGRIEEVLVDNGDAVEKGQPLVRLQPRQATDQLRQAQANRRMQQAAADQVRARLREAEEELKLSGELATQDFISRRELIRLEAEAEILRADLARAEATVESAAATVDEREWIQSQTVIRSPINGRVGRRNAEVGMRVDSGSHLFVVGDLSEVRVVIRLTEQMMRFIEVGQTALVHSQYFPDTVLRATVSRISPFLESGSFSTEALIDVPNPLGLLQSGMYVDVDILYGESEPSTLVPVSALHEDPRSRSFGVYVVTDEDGEPLDVATARRSETERDATQISYRRVTISARGRESVGVSDLEPGVWVVALGHDLLGRMEPGRTRTARVRPIEWNKLVHLQSLQSHDVLAQFLNNGNEAATARESAEARQ